MAKVSVVGWFALSFLCQPNYSVDVELCCVVVGTTIISCG